MKEELKDFSEREFPTLDKAKDIAKQLTEIERGDPCDFLVLEWAMERHMADMIEEMIPVFLETYSLLKEGEYVNGNEFDSNDADDWSCIYLNDKWKVLTIRTQNINYIFTYQEKEMYDDKKRIEFHCRRFYDDWNFKSDWKWDKEEQEKYKEIGVKHALQNLRTLNQYSDNFDDSKFVSFPNLQWYKDKEFDLHYKEKHYMTKYQSYADCRDKAYIFSYENSWLKGIDAKVDKALHFFSEIKYALFFLGSVHTVLTLKGE